MLTGTLPANDAELQALLYVTATRALEARLTTVTGRVARLQAIESSLFWASHEGDHQERAAERARWNRAIGVLARARAERQAVWLAFCAVNRATVAECNRVVAHARQGAAAPAELPVPPVALRLAA